MGASPVLGPVGAAGFEVEFVTVGGMLVRRDLSAVWDVPFEVVDRPVRSFRSYRGQRSYSGWWWMASSARHVGYESWLERDNVMVLDADPDVAAVVSQPFRLWWSDGVKPRPRRHVPDYFVRRADGGVVVIDVRADDRIEDDDAALFAATGVACRAVGWEYRRVGEVDPVLAANLRWLAGFRHPRNRVEPAAAELLRVFASPRAMFDGAAAVGDRIAVLPTLFHLLWTSELVTDMTVRLDGSAVVTSRRAA
ncbi:TnsA-like heteromeric transposase endonuclease subunit [Nocardia brasiliensis]|uniref:TnsA-like heteromeric transposase endonuclease subunit n=2 Tax=Nocardia brasiliensis TaxID=37326 RepID=A0A6G9XTV0_NOCBR|nr:TnsA-like heteromeric transposase endonuclease subunit [Nocardia brasiliensis]